MIRCQVLILGLTQSPLQGFCLGISSGFKTPPAVIIEKCVSPESIVSHLHLEVKIYGTSGVKPNPLGLGYKLAKRVCHRVIQFSIWILVLLYIGEHSWGKSRATRNPQKYPINTQKYRFCLGVSSKQKHPKQNTRSYRRKISTYIK